MDKRKTNIDMLKGIAIIAVVLYHIGLLESGYLGVDVFFVISGFLTIPSLLVKIEGSRFSFWEYIKAKFIRLLPLILIASVLCLAVGFVLWLPDDFENMSESIIASVFFSNNILSRITTGNYWNTVNDYKPFMHMWYLGILMEFYVITPLMIYLFRHIAKKRNKDERKTCAYGLGITCIVSLLLFLLPIFSIDDKFYYLPFRFFELELGGFVGLFIEEAKKIKIKKRKIFSAVSLILLIVTICIGIFSFDISSICIEKNIVGLETRETGLLLSNTILLLLSVVLTMSFIFFSEETNTIKEKNILCLIGKRSFSIFVWHQVLLALYRYSISSKITATFIIYIVAVVLFSELSYQLVEKKIKVSSKSIAATVICAAIICGVSGLIYMKSGVVRDIPELEIYTENVHRNMHSEYCDRIYAYDKDFEDNNKQKILVIGNSYARDFCNIILESGYDVDLSYTNFYYRYRIDRMKLADIIFMFFDKAEVPSYVFESCNSVYGLGTKMFGMNNGNIYSHRFADDYFSQTVCLDEGYRALNEKWKKSWGENYIDMIAPVTNADGTIRVFTDDNKYISQDCKHLTKAGAQYYSKVLDMQKILAVNDNENN